MAFLSACVGFGLGFLVLVRESPGARGRTLLSSVGFLAVLFQLFICLGGEVSGLGAPPFPTNAPRRGRQVHV